MHAGRKRRVVFERHLEGIAYLSLQRGTEDAEVSPLWIDWLQRRKGVVGVSPN